MKNKFFFAFVLLAVMLSSSTCKKQNTLETELAKLPLATQTGQNTFGCLVNGKAWVAQNKDCFILCDPSFKMYYDADNDGTIYIDVIQLNSKKEINQVIELWFDSSNINMFHVLTVQKKMTGARFINYHGKKENCKDYERYSDSSVTFSGTVNVTRYDLRLGIISGTFEFTLDKPGCDSIKVTHGRFDKKL